MLLGSVLFLLVNYVLTDEPYRNLQVVWEEIQRVYRSLGTRNKFSQIKMSMFSSRSGASPKLKGKAAEIRDLGPVLEAVWNKFKNPRISLHENIAVVLRGSAHLDRILANHPDDVVLPGPDANDMIGTAHITLTTWYDIARHFQDDDIPLFGLTPKSHLLLHCCYMSRKLNPETKKLICFVES